MMEDLITKIAVGVAGLGAGAWGMYQKIKTDTRHNHQQDVTGAAWESVVATLREEVDRLAARLAAVEEQNRKCEERNDEMHAELLQLKAKLIQ